MDTKSLVRKIAETEESPAFIAALLHRAEPGDQGVMDRAGDMGKAVWGYIKENPDMVAAAAAPAVGAGVGAAVAGKGKRLRGAAIGGGTGAAAGGLYVLAKLARARYVHNRDMDQQGRAQDMDEMTSMMAADAAQEDARQTDSATNAIRSMPFDQLTTSIADERANLEALAKQNPAVVNSFDYRQRLANVEYAEQYLLEIQRDISPAPLTESSPMAQVVSFKNMQDNEKTRRELAAQGSPTFTVNDGKGPQPGN